MVDTKANSKLAYDYAAQPKDWIAQCNLCGAERFVQLTHEDRYGYAASASLCANCGLVFLNPRLSAEAYQEFYAGVYRPLVSAYHGREINSKTIQAEQLDYAAERAGFAAPFIAPGSQNRLLDIGGSTGVVAQHFKERFGYSAKVLDPSAEELEEAKARGLETVQGLFEQVDFSEEKFDLILLCQTVDHLLDIRAALQKIRQSLTPEGFLLLDIVDFRAAYLRNWSVETAIKIDHPYYLTEPSMEAYLRRAGFSIVRKGYAADHLHINYLCTAAQPDGEYLPNQESVADLMRELRLVQNAPAGQGALQ